MRRRSRFSNFVRVGIFSAIALSAGFLSVFAYQNFKKENSTQALSATEFQAGRIIDDSIFYNPDTMTAAEIDAFIDSHSPACDMWGNGYSYGIQNKEYARRQREAGNAAWHEPPYVCVSEYYENPETHVSNFETNGQKQPGMLSVGEIIYKAAHEYNVNPQVLLVMLKKESYAWGDDWPLKWEFNTVMGYACPDGAPCNEEYFGFYNQMMMAAWQLNYYREHIYSYNYRPYATNNILYSPDRSCGSKPVYLENLATTSLYIYTPYTPNDAALANYPGTSYCGSYGNRNFYMYFREWFGDTLENPGIKKVEARYNALGGENSNLGKAMTDFPNCNIGRKNACVQAYENGVIIYSPETGAWEQYGDIRNRFVALRSVDGILKYPVGPMNCAIGFKGACVQAYENGVIIYLSETGAWEQYGDIRNKFISTGSVNGALGFPTSGIETKDGVTTQTFAGGAISTTKTGTWESYGEIYQRYLQTKDKLGQISGPMNCAIGFKGACVQAYENGVIIYSPETGAWEQYGDIRNKFISTGSVNGALGFPTSGIVAGQNGSAYQTFRNGKIEITSSGIVVSRN